MTSQNTVGRTDFATPSPDRSPLRRFGWYLTIIGISHLLVPSRWDRVTARAFPQPVRRWTLGFGVSETAIGILLTRKRTRAYGLVALLAQAAYLARRSAALRPVQTSGKR